jgi:hypothetical protein
MSDWKDKTCNICGVGSKCYVEVLMSTEDGREYPYTQTALCKKCYRKFGFTPALEHNEEARSKQRKPREFWLTVGPHYPIKCYQTPGLAKECKALSEEVIHVREVAEKEGRNK